MADFLTIRHQVADFVPWKAAYDADAPNRAAAGLTDLVCARGAEDPDLVGLIFAVGDPARARAMVQSDALRETMRKAGVVGAPLVSFRRGEFKPAPAARYLSVNATVSSFETFRKGYAMDAADRQAASLTDLAVLQKAEEPNELFLLWSVGDVARAAAFLASPELAAHQVKHAGVVGKPEARFWTAA
jgi:hypothetical protein